MDTPIFYVVPPVARALSSAANVATLEIGGVVYASSPPPPPPPGSYIGVNTITLNRGLVIRI